MINTMTQYCFILLVGIYLYVWIGYYAHLWVWLRFMGSDHGSDIDIYIEPTLSIIIAAHNEEDTIERRIINLLSIDYPKNKIQIIIASDGSSDNTVSIARKYECEELIVLDFKENRGRASVHNDSLDFAKGEILVYTDSGSIFDDKFIRNIVNKFSDKKIGCAAGRVVFKNNENKLAEISEGIYWKLENRLRSMESELGILPFASGACLVIRKSLAEKINTKSDIDNIFPLISIMKNQRVILDESAVVYEDVPVSNTGQFNRRTRIATRSMNDIMMMIRAIFRKSKSHFFVLVFHRLLKWWSCWIMLALFLLNLTLIGNGSLYNILAISQVAFYLLAAIGWLLARAQINIPRYIGFVYTFLMVNIAFAKATINYINGNVMAKYIRND